MKILQRRKKCQIFSFQDVVGQNTRRPPARPENYCESKQTYFSYTLDKARVSGKIIFHAKLSGRFLLRQPLKFSIAVIDYLIKTL